ncbi:DUF6049 family protein [Prauserella oleivorans]|uniref:DUF6049 family protein n=1 Tax=Prauserella oleivorans TaxID=1478153 RepID=A0ABW5WFY6_9PSEU
MSRLSAFALALAFLVAQGLFAVPAPAAQPLDSPNLLELDIDGFSPRIVTPSDDTLVVSGTVTNTGDRGISEVVARLQLGQPQTGEEEFEESLADAPPADAGSSEWTGIADSLEPGDSARVEFRLPIAELPLSAPGVYPLLVNVNGTPEYGGPARLASMDLMLPVIDPPSEAAPAEMSLLWPITAARPRVVSDPHNGPLVLSDDGLAGELKPGGRLDALVVAASSRRDDAAVFGSMCFAIDPELLDTVEEMSRGYRVRTPRGEIDGSGREHAARWLQQLKALVAAHCVVQIPYADADLATVSKIRTPADLVGTALNGTSILQKLGVEPRPGVVWPGGPLDGRTLGAAARAGMTSLITDPLQLDDADGTGPVDVAGSPVRALTHDSLVATAMRGKPTSGSRLTPADEPDVATQNGIAALAFRGGLGEQTEGAVIVAPPRRWNAPVGELVTFLDAVATLNRAGMVEPVSLDDLLAAPSEGTATPATDADGLDGSRSSASQVVGELSRLEATAADLQSAMTVDPTRQVQPATLIQPLHNAVLRATSTAWRPRQSTAAAGMASAQLEDLRGQVTVATPPQPVSLASGSSPLPVSLSNNLPVTITVRIRLENTAGLRPARVRDPVLSANSTLSQLIPAEALRSGRFNIDVSLTTPGGTELGEPARLELSSSELGTVTVVITVVAGAALVLLSARRIYRRVKGRNGHTT